MAQASDADKVRDSVHWQLALLTDSERKPWTTTCVRYSLATQVRISMKKFKSKSVFAQASAALLREAGFFRVLQACRNFRLACSSGTLRVSPRNAFNCEHHPWLTHSDVEDTDA
eukprot:Skav207658  [mRNA]  locus=scaffold382:248054:248820:+ [translate_table: standard]